MSNPKDYMNERSRQPRTMRAYKLQVVGPGSVGKSCLTLQFIRSLFVQDYDPTIEDSYQKQCVIDGEFTLVDVLDTAGQEQYSVFRNYFMRNGDGFLLVYSINLRDSFKEMPSFWERISRAKDADSFPAILVGNKCDLEFERRVLRDEGRELAKRLGCPFIETSAQCRINVDEAFYTVIRAIRKHKGWQTPGTSRASGTSRCVIA